MTESELRQKIVGIAQKYLGAKEGTSRHREIIDTYNAHKPLAQGYKVTYTDAWCATFVSFCGIVAGLTSIMPTECSCPRMITLYKNKGRWKESDAYNPSPGDIVMYDWQDSGTGDNQGNPDHVGIVVSNNGKTLQVIEGNNGNAVAYRALAVNGRYIRGYCVPDYASKSTGHTTKQEPTPHPAKSVDAVAVEVIAGKWGTGNARKAALEKAGYDYEAVQARVNELLGGNGAKTTEEIAREVIFGKWGNNPTRTQKLKAAGYDPVAVQKAVNKLLGKQHS